MLARSTSLLVLLAAASVVHGGAVVNLVPDPLGPYDGGEIVKVGVNLVQEPGGADRFLRFAQLDFERSSEQLGFVGDFVFRPPTICTFISCDWTTYAMFQGYPRPAAASVTGILDSESMWRLRADGMPTAIGSFEIRLPAVPGQYLLDAISPLDPDNDDLGALLIFGYGNLPGDDVTEWRPGSGLSGGRLVFTVVPEPAMAVLLAIGGLAAICRRRGFGYPRSPRRRCVSY